jgi:holliday junction DNA helicase RuvA
VIAHVRGRVVHRGSDHVVIDVQGVGYLVHVAGLDGVPARGETVELHTSLQVREDSMTLYGFPDRAGLDLFELLLTASGIGPKIALAALRTHRADVLRAALATADLTTITAVPGIGRKGAERLVLELRDKVGLDVDIAPAADGAPSTPLGEVREALVGLGYSAGEVQAALGAIDGDGTTQDLLRQALRSLGAATAGR